MRQSHYAHISGITTHRIQTAAGACLLKRAATLACAARVQRQARSGAVRPARRSSVAPHGVAPRVGSILCAQGEKHRPTLRLTGHSIGLADRAMVGLIDAAGNERLHALAEALAIAEQIEPRSLRYIAEVLNFNTENGYLAADDAATWESHKTRVSQLLASAEVRHG